MRHNYSPYTRFCAKLRRQSLLRQLPKNHPILVDFSNNDYLGLSQHPLLAQAAIEAAKNGGVGSKASRLITVEQHNLRALEQSIAAKKQTQDALVFATGFQANVSVLSALLDPSVLGATALVFSDKLNHASFYMGCALAKAKLFRYRHCDYEHLQSLLYKTRHLKQPRFILTESVFGMDGDKADFETLIPLAKQYHALIYVDEAHATGLFGHQGYGMTTDFKKDIDVSMGTFSKALGGSGAYIACSHRLKRYFINRCQGLIYSTAPSPMQIATMQSAWDIIPSYQQSVQQLLHHASQLRDKLHQQGFDTGTSCTHIIPIILKTPTDTLIAQQFLASKGIRISAIRPPSVPPNQSRLRIALNVNHSLKDIETLYESLGEYPSCNLQ